MKEIDISLDSEVIEPKSRKLPIKLPKIIDKNFRIPRKVKKKMKKRLGFFGYKYWYYMFILTNKTN